ncbi:MAG: helix-turn-helix domain-containing protein [Candidatus Aenigmarchaeota archaeon]|nr:helix-turn-helix domain-containing protein [Candidatus Aenigmarchaeota archaeon]
MSKGPDAKKIDDIMKVLKRTGKEGIWIRELARQAGMPIATVFYYLNNFMQDNIKIEPAIFGSIEHKQMKIVKLRRDKNV